MSTLKSTKNSLTTSKMKELEAENKLPPTTKEALTDRSAESKVIEGDDHLEHMQAHENADATKEGDDNDDKIKVEIKPRENYLKDKMEKEGFKAKILSGISKGMSDQLLFVKNDIKNDKLEIKNKETNLSRLIPAETDVNLPARERYDLKQRNKALKDLTSQKNNLRKSLDKLNENEKLLKDEGFLDLARSANVPKTLEENLQADKLRKIKEQREVLNEKIHEINDKISNIIYENTESSRKSKVKQFLENFERDKEIIEIRAKKYAKESKDMMQKMQNDITKIAEKRKKEIEEKEKLEETKKQEYIRKLREQEQSIIKRRLKESEEKLSKFKPYSNDKLKKKSSDYLFNQNQKKFEESEATLIKKNNLKRKQMMCSVPFEDIEEFANNFDINKSKFETEISEKKNKLYEEWNERKELLPKYISPFFEKAESESKKVQDESEARREKAEILKKRQNDYCDKVQKTKKPAINEKLKKERLDKIKQLQNPAPVKDTLHQRKKPRIILKKKDPTKPSKYKWKLKLEDDNVEKLNNSLDYINQIKKPKKINLSSSMTRKKSPVPDKPIDYLKELKQERMQKELNRSRSANKDEIQIRNNKWNKMIANPNADALTNIYNVKLKIESLEQEVEMKEKLLKVNGGIENNPELGERISSLLIDSIEAKLSILNQPTKTAKKN